MPLTYSGNIIRQHDYDRYLLSLFAPYAARPHLWALFAFNYEIAKTREVVSDTTIGLIRLQWWRDAIAGIYDGKSGNSSDVISALADTIKTHDLPREDFEALIYAREFDLEGVAPANLEGLINYCDYTTTPLTRLAMKIIGETVDDDALKAISVHYGMIGTLRAVPYMMKQRRLMLPQDILAKNNIPESKIFDFNEVKDLPKVISEVISGVEPYRNDQSKVKSRFLKAMMVMTVLYEKQITDAKFDVLDASMAHAPKFMALRVWLKSFL
jgi:phytoene synthase